MPTPAFHCVVCGRRIQAPANTASSILECPHCRRMVPVPSHAALPGEITCAVPALPPEILAVEVKFACEACNSKLGIDIRMAGLLVTCPVCSARIRAPRLGGMRGSLPGPAVSGTAATSLLSVAETEFLTGAGESPVKAVAAR